MYDVRKDVWSALPGRPDNTITLPFPLVIDRKVYFFGGLNRADNNQHVSLVESFDLDTEEWEINVTQPALAVPSTLVGIAAFYEDVLVLGGQ